MLFIAEFIGTACQPKREPKQSVMEKEVEKEQYVLTASKEMVVEAAKLPSPKIASVVEAIKTSYALRCPTMNCVEVEVTTPPKKPPRPNQELLVITSYDIPIRITLKGTLVSF